MNKIISNPNQQEIILGKIPTSSNPFVIAKIYEEISDNILVITHNDIEAKQTEEFLSKLLPSAHIVYFPAWDCQPYDRVSPKKVIIGERIRALADIEKSNLEGNRYIVITTVNALLTKVIPEEVIANSQINLKIGQKIRQEEVRSFLVENGYQYTSNVTDSGEFSVKGSLIDIFPIDLDKPIRVDFLGNEIDAIKIFDPFSQLSIDNLQEVRLISGGEVILNKTTIANFKDNIHLDFAYEVRNMSFYEAVENGVYYPALEHLLPLFYNGLVSFTSYLKDFRLIFNQDIKDGVRERFAEIKDYYLARKSYLETLSEKNFIAISPDKLYLEEEDFENLIVNSNSIKLSLFATEGINSQNLEFNAVPDFYKEAKIKGKTATELFIDYAKDVLLKSKQSKILISTFTSYSFERITKLLSEYDIKPISCSRLDNIKRANVPYIMQLPIEKGFIYEDLVIVSEQDLLGSKVQRAAGKRRGAEKLILEASALDVEEYVVHREHGIGQFLGLQNIRVKDLEHDFLVIAYSGGDKLYVPVENIELISKYGGNVEGAKLDSLGSSNWQERKAKLKNKIKEIASELVRIASLRKLKEAGCYYADSLMQEEFNAKFPYTETEDQERAIKDVLKDLEQGTPMDRLICGDVGFGKTEVALRAAFAAVSSENKGVKNQVAVIVPTTLLARQHYKNFKERFSDFGIRVGQLSRMISAKEKKQVKEDLERGKIDIIVGTHALLAKDIKFRNLALVIVDEEQHFGVVQKENLKKLRTNVHLLTLSATPIPRTLQMSLTGIRDLSLIATAPVDRMAVRSFVMPFDDVVIREAILREFHRGGRVYFVCPRVKDLAPCEEKLRKLVPEIKLVTAHGQMPAVQLDKIMTDFCDGKYQLLLSTTIIESGIDIQDANTLIVHNADMFGLSALYQLRGRVGRGKIRAYAYFTVDERKILNSKAKQRLEVMQTLDGLGAGFSLASYDLDIRGAGNLLGEEQSGHIKEVGVELYQKMLQDELELQRSGLSKIDGEEDEIKADKLSPTVNLGLSVRIPEKYIPDLSARIAFYKRVATADTKEEAEQIAYEMQDRFGKLPVEVANLFSIVEIKQRCKDLNILKLDAGDKAMVIKFYDNQFKDPKKLITYIAENPLRMKIRPDQNIVIKYGAIGANFLLQEVDKGLSRLEQLQS